MTHYEKNTHNNKWNSNHQDYAEAHPEGVIPVIIQHKYKWAQDKTYHHNDNAANKFPFPGNYEKSQ